MFNVSTRALSCKGTIGALSQFAPASASSRDHDVGPEGIHVFVEERHQVGVAGDVGAAHAEAGPMA